VTIQPLCVKRKIKPFLTAKPEHGNRRTDEQGTLNAEVPERYFLTTNPERHILNTKARRTRTNTNEKQERGKKSRALTNGFADPDLFYSLFCKQNLAFSQNLVS